MEIHRQRSKHLKYLRDLEEAQGTLERVRSNSRLYSRVNASGSQKGFHENIVANTYAKKSRNELKDPETWQKQNVFPKHRSKIEWENTGKSSFMENKMESSCVKQGKLSLTSKIYKQKQSEQNLEGQQQTKSIQLEISKSSKTKFIEQTKTLFNSTGCNSENSLDNIQKIVKEIDLRDKVYDKVRSRFPDQDPSILPELLTKSFEKQKLLVKIVKVFKRMSKVDIENYAELYEFLREEEDTAQQEK